MILFNTTFVIDPGIDMEFRMWVRDKFIPSGLNGGLTEPLLTRILPLDLPGMEDQESQSYAVQFKAPSVEFADEWMSRMGVYHIGNMQDKHGQNFLSFSTFMEIL